MGRLLPPGLYPKPGQARSADPTGRGGGGVPVRRSAKRTSKASVRRVGDLGRLDDPSFRWACFASCESFLRVDAEMREYNRRAEVLVT
jgi:hypothetical protein